METRCPECQIIFRVAEEQLAVADGQVRCGECSHVFHAREHLVEPELDTTTIEVPEVTVDEITLDTRDEKSSEQLEDAEINDTGSDEQASTEEVTGEPAENGEPSAEEQSTEADEGENPEEENGQTETSGYDVTALYPELDKPPAFKPPPSTRETVTWSVAILVMIGILFSQLTYFNRDTLAKKPKLRPLMETMCKKLDCELTGRRAPALVRLQQHKVLSHPLEKGALRVEAIIMNEANFSQAYPVMRLRFRDLDGNLLATRDFLPKHYLPTDVNRTTGMAPGEPVNAVLDIIDPGKKAISYEFDFL